jgi:hypothetical protein
MPRKLPFGLVAVGAGETRRFADANVARNSTMYLVSTIPLLDLAANFL